MLKNSHNAILVGIGPHAKRIYIKFFKKYKNKIKLSAVIDLESNEDKIRKYLNDNGFEDTVLLTIPDKLKDNKHLPKLFNNKLKLLCDILNITEIVISTEPKAHYMYIEFALKNNIKVLTDKPITVTKNMISKSSISMVRNDYYRLYKLADKSKVNCYIMCQRQYHKGYLYIRKLLEEIVKKYGIPITYIDIYHCDGNWEMPHDLYKENHPYKYGYGKLFHSGYHFIDLLSELLKINNIVSPEKQIISGSTYCKCFTPNDELAVFNFNDYKRIFKNQRIPEFYNKLNVGFPKFGEKNLYSMLTFKNKDGQTITTANLNLLHYGFSRRGWIESRDFYKSNGRIRHERINIQVGTLLNVQVHSYQSKEIKDRIKDNLVEEESGGLEHFDIEIFRNTDIIGGKPYEKIKLGDLYESSEKKDFIGYNELAREEFLKIFFSRKDDTKSNLQDQTLGIEILNSCAKGIHHNYYNTNKEEKINYLMQYKYYYKINLDYLKKFSNRALIECEKDLLDHFEIIKDKYIFGVNVNYIKLLKKYEVYLTINSNKRTVGSLMKKIITHKLFAYLYFIYLKSIIYTYNSRNIIKKCTK